MPEDKLLDLLTRPQLDHAVKVSGYPEDVDALCRTADLLAPHAVIVELGTRFGGSLVVWGRHTNLRGGIVFTIDNCMERGLLAEGDAMRMMKDLGVGDNLIFIIGDTWHLAWPKLEIDLLFIDADHTMHATENDFVRWEPRVKPGGIIVFHDCNLIGPEEVSTKYCDQWEHLVELGTVRSFRKPRESVNADL